MCVVGKGKEKKRVGDEGPEGNENMEDRIIGVRSPVL